MPCELVTYPGEGHGVGTMAERQLRGDAFVAEHVLGPLGYFDVTADAGGPYEVAEGSTVTLDATASDGDDLAWSWSPADRFDDPASPTPDITALDDGTGPLGLTVTSNHGVIDQTETRLTTTNVAPPSPPRACPPGPTHSPSRSRRP